MGDPSVEVTEEMRDAANIEKLKAMNSISQGMASAYCHYHCYQYYLIVKIICPP